MLHCSVARHLETELALSSSGDNMERKQCHLTTLGLWNGTCCVELWVTHATEALLLSTPMLAKCGIWRAELLKKFFFCFFFLGGGEIGKKGRWARATPKIRDAAWTIARQTSWNEWLPKFWGGFKVRSNVAANLPLFGKVWHLEGWTAGEALPSPNKKKTHWHPGNELMYRIRAWRGPRREWLRGGTPVGVPCLKFLRWMLAYQQNSITQTTQNIDNKIWT